jgi:hypothetical protein
MAALVRRRDRLRSARGAALVEFALVLPLLLVMIGGIVDFAFLFQRYEVVTGAAREGARIAALPGYGCVSGQVEIRARQFLMAGLHMTAGQLLGVVPAGNITVTCGTLPAPLTTIHTVRVDVTYQHTFLLLGPVMGLIGAGGWGGSPLNMTGTSEMRMEMAP